MALGDSISECALRVSRFLRCTMTVQSKTLTTARGNGYYCANYPPRRHSNIIEQNQPRDSPLHPTSRTGPPTASSTTTRSAASGDNSPSAMCERCGNRPVGFFTLAILTGYWIIRLRKAAQNLKLRITISTYILINWHRRIPFRYVYDSNSVGREGQYHN